MVHSSSGTTRTCIQSCTPGSEQTRCEVQCTSGLWLKQIRSKHDDDVTDTHRMLWCDLWAKRSVANVPATNATLTVVGHSKDEAKVAMPQEMLSQPWTGLYGLRSPSQDAPMETWCCSWCLQLPVAHSWYHGVVHFPCVCVCFMRKLRDEVCTYISRWETDQNMMHIIFIQPPRAIKDHQPMNYYMKCSNFNL